MIRGAILALVAGGGVIACVQADMPDQIEGRAVYVENCAMCHGDTARGDGPAGASLRPHPADLTVLSRGNGGAFPVNRVLSQIDGYLRGDLPGQDMPEFGLLLEGDLVPVETDDGALTPTPRPLAALLAYLETVQR